MTYVTTLTSKGQVTIPAPLRKLLDLKPYEKVGFEQVKEGVLIRPAKDFLKLRGSVRPVKNISDSDLDEAVGAYIKDEYEKKDSSG